MPEPRSILRKFSPYVAGKSLEEIRKETGLKQVFKLASNENPWGPSPSVLRVLRRFSGTVNRYPDAGYTALKKSIADFWKVPSSSVTVGAGSDELIEILAKAFIGHGDSVLFSRYAFIRYKMAGWLMGASLEEVPALENLGHDAVKMAEKASGKTKLIFIANPNNPTAGYISNAEFEQFWKIYRKKRLHALVVMDEAYAEYVAAEDYPQSIKWVRRGYPLIFLRTFSKAYGLAGLRVGYGISSASIIDSIERIRPPFSVTSLSQRAAVAALEDQVYLRSIVRSTLREKHFLEKELNKNNVKFKSGVANFLLIRVTEGKKVFERLLAKGIIVRSMDEYGLPGWIRVTVGKREENRRFLRFFIELVKEGKS